MYSSERGLILRSQGCDHTQTGLVDDMIHGLNGNRDGPMTTHIQVVAGSAELAIGGGLERNRIGAHRHILHRCVERNSHDVGWSSRLVIEHTDREHVGTRMVWRNIEGNSQRAIERLNRPMKWFSYSYGRRRICWSRRSSGCKGHTTASQEQAEHKTPDPCSVKMRAIEMSALQYTLSKHKKSLRFRNRSRKCVARVNKAPKWKYDSELQSSGLAGTHDFMHVGMCQMTTILSYC